MMGSKRLSGLVLAGLLTISAGARAESVLYDIDSCNSSKFTKPMKAVWENGGLERVRAALVKQGFGTSAAAEWGEKGETIIVSAPSAGQQVALKAVADTKALICGTETVTLRTVKVPLAWEEASLVLGNLPGSQHENGLLVTDLSADLVLDALSYSTRHRDAKMQFGEESIVPGDLEWSKQEFASSGLVRVDLGIVETVGQQLDRSGTVEIGQRLFDAKSSMEPSLQDEGVRILDLVSMARPAGNAASGLDGARAWRTTADVDYLTWFDVPVLSDGERDDDRALKSSILTVHGSVEPHEVVVTMMTVTVRPEVAH